MPSRSHGCNGRADKASTGEDESGGRWRKLKEIQGCLKEKAGHSAKIVESKRNSWPLFIGFCPEMDRNGVLSSSCGHIDDECDDEAMDFGHSFMFDQNASFCSGWLAPWPKMFMAEM